jgi:hypothetical protein
VAAFPRLAVVTPPCASERVSLGGLDSPVERARSGDHAHSRRALQLPGTRGRCVGGCPPNQIRTTQRQALPFCVPRSEAGRGRQGAQSERDRRQSSRHRHCRSPAPIVIRPKAIYLLLAESLVPVIRLPARLMRGHLESRPWLVDADCLGGPLPKAGLGVSPAGPNGERRSDRTMRVCPHVSSPCLCSVTAARRLIVRLVSARNQRRTMLLGAEPPGASPSDSSEPPGCWEGRVPSWPAPAASSPVAPCHYGS